MTVAEARELLQRAGEAMQRRLAEVPGACPWNTAVLSGLLDDLAPHVAKEVDEYDKTDQHI